MKKKIWLWSPLIVCLVVILYISSIQIPGIPGLPGADISFIHLPLYFILSALFLRIFIEKRRSFISAILCSTMYGILIEIFQLFLPWRSFSFYDIILNFIGSCFVYIFISINLRKILLIPRIKS
ncbi:MAG: VanZ family protein [Candidatus Aenigmatarchaeota archaeon]|nr:MAG: VanZ family protein [Candidatus Aenigmarchaeota archaeon]